ncbi:hypothetical protein F7734_04325 [Scytonema sp. UIC 10036]|uniref:hypothetical protein n=1 Tax=Scytonema sp. UIC 10036 TaxID=2304196 RepID=UPI0012DA9005|nr:hypothetical protein [Scytonema sp. UIC 10036]MUG91746.1 hypothetical protein [Scytonema sp. UIC 10036]
MCILGGNRKTNRDHAKKTHRPMVEDEVIAEQLSALLRRLEHYHFPYASCPKHIM